MTVPAAPARWPEAVCAAAPAAAVAVLYHRAVGLWWLGDDPALLAFAGRFRPRDYFFDPAAVAELPWHLLTPVQALAYDLDLALWGGRPAAAHAVQLAVLAAVASLLYAVLRLWLERWAALAAALLFVLGAPVAAAAPQLMVRHYLIGLAPALAAVALWVPAVRRRRAALAWLAAGSYLVAAAAKEVFVPLPLVLLLLPERSLGDRLRRVVPLGAALAVYLAWRWRMLGTLAGGYGFVAEPGEWPRLVPALLVGAARGLFGGGAAGWALAAAVAVAVAAVGWRRPAAAGALVAAGALALAPALPVARAMAPRYLLLPWLWVAVAVVLGGRALLGGRAAARRPAAARPAGIDAPGSAAGRLDHALGSPPAPRAGSAPGGGAGSRDASRALPASVPGSGPRLAPALGVAVLVVGATAAALAGGRAWGDLVPRLEREGAAGRFVHDRGPSDLLRRPQAPSHYLEAVAALGTRHGSHPAGWFDDDLFLCLHPDLGAETPPGGSRPARGPERVWQQVPGIPGFTDVTTRLPSLRRRTCAAIRDHAPLAARFEWHGGRLAWRLGPHPGDGWAFVFADGRRRVEVPRQGDLRLGARRGAALRVRYRDPGGWVTYSPELRLDFTTEGNLEWAR